MGGTIDNFGTINNNFGSLLTNFEATLNNKPGGIINNNFDEINNNGGTINNFGSTNDANLNNDGTINNFHRITNSVNGVINNNFDEMNNNRGVINNFSLIRNISGGIINNDSDTYNFCGGTIFGAAISGFPAVDACDTDGDNIADSVDSDSNNPSVDFSDVSLGGMTTGQILNPNDHDQILRIRDDSNPANGIRIITEPSGGNIAAEISVCGGISEAFLSGANEVRGTCGSITWDVISGQIQTTLTAVDGTIVTITLNQGDNVTYDEFNSGQITNNGLEEIIISINDGDPISITTGETLTIGESDKVVLCHKGKNTISVSENAKSAHLAHGDTLGPCP